MKLHMSSPTVLATLLGVLALAEAAKQPKDSVLLRNIKSLTLRKDLKTANRRVSAIPQLKCVGGSGKGHYEVDVMRCTNSGASYDENEVDWTCKASLPEEFKLGSSDVICEGYSSPDDPYILKGSCGVEYRLVLTDVGEEKYGSSSWFKSKPATKQTTTEEEPKSEQFFNFLFWCLFIGVAGLIAYTFIKSLITGGGDNPQRRRNPTRGGGGGGGGYDDGNDPPPPYDSSPPGYGYTKPSTSSQGSRSSGPGFWSGAAAGAAAGYFAGNRGTRTRAQQQQDDWLGRGNHGAGSSWFGGGNNNAGGNGSSWFGRSDNGEGSSGTRGSSSSSPSTTRYESTGFGSTRRR